MSELGCIYWNNGTCIIWMPHFLPSTTHHADTTGNDYDEDRDDFYDPYEDDDPDDPWEDPGLPPEESIDYPTVPSINNGEFTIFFTGYGASSLVAASYPFQRTENGRPLFQYMIQTEPGMTNFTISDNIGDSIISIEEELIGKFCAKLTHRAGQMTVKVWGGSTTEPFEIASVSSRNVTFDSSKIIAGN